MTFDSTTPDIDVLARPVDAVERTDVSSKANSLAKALGLFGQVGENALQSYQQIQDYDKKQGEFMALKGDEKPTEGQALIKGYELAQGRLDSYKYQAELNQFIQENGNVLSPEEFQAGIDSITQKYLDSAPSDDYYKGFLPKAQAIEQEAILGYQELVAEDVYEKSINTVGGLISGEALTFLSKNLGIKSFEEMDEIIKNDPEKYQDIVAKSEVGEIHQGVREILTDIQDTAKDMNIDRQTTSEIMVRQMGELAARYGLPSLMDFSGIPDESKITIKSNPELMKLIDDYEEKAQAKQDRIMEVQDAQAAKDEAKAQNRFINDITQEMTELEMIQNEDGGLTEAAERAEAYRDELWNNEEFQNLPRTDVRMIEDNLQRIIEGKNLFRRQSLKPVFDDLFQGAIAGRVNKKDIFGSSQYLSQSDYKFLVGVVQAREDELEREQEAADRAEEADAQKRQAKLNSLRGQRYDRKLNNLVGFIGENPALVRTSTISVEDYFQEKLTDYLQVNNFMFPDMETMDKWFDNYIATYIEGMNSYGDIIKQNTQALIEEGNTSEGQLNNQINAAQGGQPEEPQGWWGRLTSALTPNRENLENSPYASTDNLDETLSTQEENRANNPYTSAISYVEQNKNKVEASETGRKPFSYDSEQIFSNIDRFRAEGMTLREIIVDGEQKGVFTRPSTLGGTREGMVYAQAYAVDLARKVFEQEGDLATDRVIQMLQDEGFSYEGAVQIAREANALVVPNQPKEEE